MKNSIERTINIFGVPMLRKRESADELDIETIYDQFAQSLFRYACTITCSPEDAEDAVQEVFARLSRERQRSSSIESIKTYLFTAIRNASFSLLRKRRRRSELMDSATCFPDAASSEDLAELSVLRDAFSQLPVDQREVLVLKIYDQMTFQEIADTTGVSVNTVASRYRYGLDKLRQSLEVNENE